MPLETTVLPLGAATEVTVAKAATEVTVSKRFAGGKTTRAVRITSSGDNSVRTPASGKYLRKYWIALNTADDGGTEVLAIVKFGTTEIYRWNLGSPGAFMHWEPSDGAVDQALVVNLSAARNVEVNYTVEELAP
jgi:hypothetical protein